MDPHFKSNYQKKCSCPKYSYRLSNYAQSFILTLVFFDWASQNSNPLKVNKFVNRYDRFHFGTIGSQAETLRQSGKTKINCRHQANRRRIRVQWFPVDSRQS